MISKRLLSKLESGKKYLISDGIRYLILKPENGIIWCSELGWVSSCFFGIYMKDWESVLKENESDSNYYYDLKYNYDKTQPTYQYCAHLSHFFASGRVDFSLYDLYFLGEYKDDTDLEKVKKYCDIYGINFRWLKKSERRKRVYNK